MLPRVIVGKAFTVTLPEILFDKQPFAFLTIKMYEILEPDAPALKLTVIGVAGKATSVTVVIPTPETEYSVGVAVVAVYGIVNDVAPAHIAGLALLVKVGFVFTVTLPVTLLDVQTLAFLTVKVYAIEVPLAPLLKFTTIGLVVKVPFVTVVIPVPEIE